MYPNNENELAMYKRCLHAFLCSCTLIWHALLEMVWLWLRIKIMPTDLTYPDKARKRF